jgi:hypothetical protein
MGKPRRPLWELNNRNAAFWGRPLRAEPQGGFAEEELPRGFYEVIGWFRDAMPEQCRTQEVPIDEIARIARLIDNWQKMAARPGDVDALQRAIAVLKATLEPMLDRLLTCDNDAALRLVELWRAVNLVEPHIGFPSGRGRPSPVWHIWAAGLEQPVQKVLSLAGAPRAIWVDGPLVAVICQALSAIDGEERTPEAVERALKRRRKRTGQKNR